MSSSRVIKGQAQHGHSERRFELQEFTQNHVLKSRPRTQDIFQPDRVAGAEHESSHWQVAEFQDADRRITYRGGQRIDGQLQQAEAESKAKLQEAEQRGYQRGYDEGSRQAKAAGEARISQAVAGLNCIVEAVQSLESRLSRHLETHLLSLATIIAEKLLKRELRHDPEVVLDMVRAALQTVNNAFELDLLVSPDDHALILDHQAEILEDCQNIRQLRIVVDQALRSGDCRVQATSGDVDARLEAQLDEILAQISHDVTLGRQPKSLPPTA